MKIMKNFILVAIVVIGLLLVGCAQYEPLPGAEQDDSTAGSAVAFNYPISASELENGFTFTRGDSQVVWPSLDVPYVDMNVSDSAGIGYIWSPNNNLYYINSRNDRFARFIGQRTNYLDLDDMTLLAGKTYRFVYILSDLTIQYAEPVEDVVGESVWTKAGNEVYYNEGNVGIGRDDPRANLHIAQKQGNDVVLRLESLGINPVDFFHRSDNSGGIWHQGGPILLGTQNQEKFRISTKGNVGIGVTSPSEKLDVAGNIKASGSVCDGFGNCLSDSGSQPSNGTESGLDRCRYTASSNNDGDYVGINEDILITSTKVLCESHERAISASVSCNPQTWNITKDDMPYLGDSSRLTQVDGGVEREGWSASCRGGPAQVIVWVTCCE